jgi:hypothetical protein
MNNVKILSGCWTGMPGLSKLTMGSRLIWFSYEEPIAFFTPSTGLVVSTNQWGTTTGKHLNFIARETEVPRTLPASFRICLGVAFGID